MPGDRCEFTTLQRLKGDLVMLLSCSVYVYLLSINAYVPCCSFFWNLLVLLFLRYIKIVFNGFYDS